MGLLDKPRSYLRGSSKNFRQPVMAEGLICLEVVSHSRKGQRRAGCWPSQKPDVRSLGTLRSYLEWECAFKWTALESALEVFEGATLCLTSHLSWGEQADTSSSTVKDACLVLRSPPMGVRLKQALCDPAGTSLSHSL